MQQNIILSCLLVLLWATSEGLFGFKIPVQNNEKMYSFSKGFKLIKIGTVSKGNKVKRKK